MKVKILTEVPDMKYPSLEEINKTISNIKNIQFPKPADFLNFEDYLSELEIIIFKEFQTKLNLIKLLKPQSFLNTFFRARDLSQISDKDLFCEHSYPPINYTKIGRCNFPNKPVFYCSSDPITSLIEIIKNNDYKNKKFCISRWEIINSEKEFAMQSFIHLNWADKENPFYKIMKKDREQIDMIFVKLTSDEKLGLKKYLSFLHDIFLNDKEYYISACIAHQSLYAKHNIATDIILYPSILTKYNGINMAIHPNFVYNMMKIELIYEVELISYNFETNEFEITIHNYGYIEKNRVVWKNASPEDELFMNYFSIDFSVYQEFGNTLNINHD